MIIVLSIDFFIILEIWVSLANWLCKHIYNTWFNASFLHSTGSTVKKYAKDVALHLDSFQCFKYMTLHMIDDMVFFFV